MKKINQKLYGKVIGGLLFLSLGIAICFPTQTYAMVEKNSGIGLYMEKISSCDVDLSISSTGKANVSGCVRAKTGRTYIKVKLQKLSGNTWISVKSWEYSSSGKVASIIETYQVSRGTYRVVAYVKADTESKTIYSDKRVY